jgi:aminodeoxyfutalosine deaminase
MLLKALWILPVSSPPIESGVAVVEEGFIRWVGTVHELPRQYRDSTSIPLGDATLLPGLVNTHGHLEHSALKGLTTPKLPFTEWVKEVTRLKASLSKDDLHAGAKHGIEVLVRGGTTTLADHIHPDSKSFETPFRRIIFWEVLGAHVGRARESLEKARRRAADEGGFVSPHSLYAVHEEILEEMFDRNARSLQSIHLLESADEDQFFRHQTGPLAVYVQERGGDLSFPVSSPVQWLAANHRLNERLLAVHANYLSPTDIAALRGSGASVIHCPGSHRFLGHKSFPLEEFRKAGIRVAIGTDSLASNEDLSMLREMRLLHEEFPALTEEEVLKMATIEGARALGLEKEIGSIEVGKKADLIAVRGPLSKAQSVVFSMINGKTCLNP